MIPRKKLSGTEASQANEDLADGVVRVGGLITELSGRNRVPCEDEGIDGAEAERLPE